MFEENMLVLVYVCMLSYLVCVYVKLPWEVEK